MHRERNHDGTVFSSSGVDVRREDRKRLEEDTVAKRKDSIYLFSKHRDVAIMLRLGTFQLSDIFYNTVGGVVGGLVYYAVMKVRKCL